MTRLVAIGSGKGGVGKTWFAISLSHALGRFGCRTLLVDADVGLANIDVQLGLDEDPNIATTLINDNPLSRSIRRVSSLGFDLLPGQSGSGGMAALDDRWAERMLKALQALEARYDLIVLDLPSGIDIGMRRLMMAADDPIVVTTSEPTALTDAYALMKALRRHQPGLIPRIVVNLAESKQAGQRVFEGLSRVCDRFLGMKPLSLGTVRRDRRVIEAIGRQTPLFQCYPNADAALDALAVAGALLDKAVAR